MATAMKLPKERRGFGNVFDWMMSLNAADHDYEEDKRTGALCIGFDNPDGHQRAKAGDTIALRPDGYFEVRAA